jgi:hypothetical protein
MMLNDLPGRSALLPQRHRFAVIAAGSPWQSPIQL